MKINVYLDGNEEVYRVIRPPESFKFDTKELADGHHSLRFCVIEDNVITSQREIDFKVQNGPNISLHGIRDGDVVSGNVNVLANAYSSRIGDEFEPIRIENPVPIPTWAWVLCLVTFAWAVGYLTLEYGTYRPEIESVNISDTSSSEIETTSVDNRLGEQIYGNYCASCHQANGQGLPGVFPSLVGNESVLNSDASEHIRAILKGLSGKIIDGVDYPTPMPGFGNQLSDEEVAAVVNHERMQWGNNATIVTSGDVALLR